MTLSYVINRIAAADKGRYLIVLLLLFAIPAQAQLTISKMLCRNCDCYKLSLKNTSKDTFYVIGFAWYYKYYDCIDGNIQADSANRVITIPLSANFDSFRQERGDWKIIYPGDSSALYIPKWVLDNDYKKMITAQVFYGRYRHRYKGTPDSRNRKLAKRLLNSGERTFFID